MPDTQPSTNIVPLPRIENRITQTRNTAAVSKCHSRNIGGSSSVRGM